MFFYICIAIAVQVFFYLKKEQSFFYIFNYYYNDTQSHQPARAGCTRRPQLL